MSAQTASPLKQDVNTPSYWDMTHARWRRHGNVGLILSERLRSWRLIESLLPAAGRFLEVGCGIGAFLVYLRQRPLELFGLDFSAGGLWMGKTAAPAVEFQVGDGCRLPFASGAFDVVYSGHFLEHIANPAAALAEQRRVLRAGGVAIVHFPLDDKPYVEHLHDHIRFETVGRWLAEAGFPGYQIVASLSGPPVREGIVIARREIASTRSFAP